MEQIIHELNQATKRFERLKMEGIEAKEPTARDWAGFFAALAAFAQAILPLILPLFATSEAKK
jgi:hypothetical protein